MWIVPDLQFSVVLAQQEYETHSVPVIKDYVDAIDAATQEMIADSTFVDTFYKLMFFPVCKS